MSQNRCPACQLPTIPDAKYCDHCGFALFNFVAEKPEHEEPVVILCRECGHRNLAAWKYCEKCGAEIVTTQSDEPEQAPGMYFKLLKSSQRIEFPGNKTSFLIGRQDAENDIFPEIDLTPLGAQNFGIGRRHAKITLQGTEVFIEDLNSVNGTLVNRVKISTEKPQQLKDGDEVRLGKLILIFCQS